MNIQVRIGSSRNPEDNRLYFDASPARNQHITVPCDHVCWYRRDADPNMPDGSYTKWMSRNCMLNSNCEIENP